MIGNLYISVITAKLSIQSPRNCLVLTAKDHMIGLKGIDILGIYRFRHHEIRQDLIKLERILWK